MINNKQDVKMSLRCPKCRSDHFQIMEYYIAAMNFEVYEGVLRLSEGTPSPDYEMMNKLGGICIKCEHHWTLRGVNQIIDLVK